MKRRNFFKTLGVATILPIIPLKKKEKVKVYNPKDIKIMFGDTEITGFVDTEFDVTIEINNKKYDKNIRKVKINNNPKDYNMALELKPIKTKYKKYTYDNIIKLHDKRTPWMSVVGLDFKDKAIQCIIKNKSAWFIRLGKSKYYKMVTQSKYLKWFAINSKKIVAKELSKV
jgi:hypothetical protein